MDIQAYISSGIIECYVLGATTPEETAEVERLAEEFPEIKQEIEANKFALTEYVMSYQVEPPQEIKHKVMEKLDFLLGEEETSSPAKTLSVSSRSSRLMNSSRFLTYLTAACLIGLLFSAWLNVMLYRNLRNTRKELDRLIGQNLLMTENLKTSQDNLQKISKEMEILSNPANKIVELKGLKEFPTSYVALYWNTQTKDVYLQLKNLPPAPKGKQYQLWAITQDQVLDAGVIEKSSKHIYQMKNITQAKAFAITLEKEGGVPKAEGKMYVLGEVI